MLQSCCGSVWGVFIECTAPHALKPLNHQNPSTTPNYPTCLCVLHLTPCGIAATWHQERRKDGSRYTTKAHTTESHTKLASILLLHPMTSISCHTISHQIAHCECAHRHCNGVAMQARHQMIRYATGLYQTHTCTTVLPPSLAAPSLSVITLYDHHDAMWLLVLLRRAPT